MGKIARSLTGVAAVALLAAVVVAGTWAAGICGPLYGHHDSRRIVIDEVGGMMVTLWSFPADPLWLAAEEVVERERPGSHHHHDGRKTTARLQTGRDSLRLAHPTGKTLGQGCPIVTRICCLTVGCLHIPRQSGRFCFRLFPGDLGIGQYPTLPDAQGKSPQVKNDQIAQNLTDRHSTASNSGERGTHCVSRSCAKLRTWSCRQSVPRRRSEVKLTFPLTCLENPNLQSRPDPWPDH